MAEERIPLARPVIGDREEELVLEVLRSGMLSLGPMLGRFERAFADRLGVADAVAVSSGTSALHLAVRELGWGAGDEVVTTPLSFVASSNCLLFEDAKPVFVDVDPATLTLDPAGTEAAIGDATKGILPVHIFGFPAAMAELERIAADRGLGVLEDCAQALGMVDADGNEAGSRGNPAAFAFYANKQMTTGEGGMLVPPSEAAADLARSERNQGRAPGMKLSDAGALSAIEQIKRREHLGYHYEAADASFELLLRREAGSYEPLFRLESFRVVTEKRADGQVETEATIKIWIGEERYIRTAEGNGPVNALDRALRAAITDRHPEIAEVELTNFKVRILDEHHGTGSVTRVLLDSSDGDASWGSIGVSENVIEASWEALVDSLEYAFQPRRVGTRQ